MSTSDGSSSIGSLSEISEVETVRFSIDLVAAAKRNLGFLKLVNDSQWLHQKPTILEAIRRYDQLWMPLFADLNLGPKPPMILPPLDIEWVWYCHTLNPTSYKHYCESRFSKLIGKPTIFDEQNEEYALNRGRQIWEQKFSSEPFENEADMNLEDLPVFAKDLLDEVLKHRYLYNKFSEPYSSDMEYLVASKQRYKGFIYMVQRFANECSLLVPASDVLLMWITHQSYPTIYATDVKELESDIEKIVGSWEAVDEVNIKETKMLWERTFDQPYEKAGGAIITSSINIETPLYWDVSDIDVNTRYKSMIPRFLFELCISVKLSSKMKQMDGNEFLCLRMVKCHRELKLDKPISRFTSESWMKAYHLYCEFGTKGTILELRQQATQCFRSSTLQHSVKYTWNNLLRSPSLTSHQEVNQRLRAVASITPPVQASYLLKCVPDRVTDDSGAMISDVILKMNRYSPQAGRWLSRTVLDHAGRECFIVRMRMGGGFWRRGGEAPSTVKWEDRIIEIREGSWSYVSNSTSIGRAPEKVVGTATPKEPQEGFQASWSLSTGDKLSIQWDPLTPTSGPTFDMLNEQSRESTVKLLKGRQMQFHVKKSGLKTKEGKEEGLVEGDDQFVTIVRFSDENPTGKATALLNWKLQVVELLPEEDAVFTLLLCLSILRSVSEMKKEDIGGLLVRRRIREPRIGDRDWGSVILHPSSYSTSTTSPYFYPWYWDADVFMAKNVKDYTVNTPASAYSQAEGGDKLYKRGIIA